MERRKRQLPLTPAYSFTDYRSQGQTIQNIIIDIGNPPSGTLTPFNIYVALSRARGRNQIQLLRDFDDKLLTKHPSEYLRLEDERLGDLETKTDEWWQRILLSKQGNLLHRWKQDWCNAVTIQCMEGLIAMS